MLAFSIFIYNNHKKNEVAVFEHSMDYIISKYKEDENFRNVGIRYDSNRGNYFFCYKTIPVIRFIL